MPTLGIVASQITGIPLTANPTIVSVTYTPGIKLLPNSVSGSIRNNDPDTASITAGTTNPPTQPCGTAAYNATVSYLIEDVPYPGVVYARAQATGKDPSSVVSYYYE